MAKKKHIVTNAMRMLTAAKIPFEVIEYEAEEVTKNFGSYIAELTGIPPEQAFKTLVGMGDKTGPVVAVIGVDDEVDLKKLAVASGNKSVSLLPVKDLLALTGYIRGSVSPVGMKKKFPTFVSSKCLEFEKMGVSGGMCGITLMLKPSDLEKATGAKMCEITYQ